MLDPEYEIMQRLENHHWWFTAKKRFIKTLLDVYLKPGDGNILDIGCGTGGMIELLKHYGPVFGLDRHQAACAFFHRSHPFPLVKGDANRLPFKKGSFQLISLLDVLYHQYIIDDGKVLDQIHDLLTPAGFLLITDSAFEFLRGAHDRAVMARHRYTLKELKDKAVAHGFSVQRGSYLFCSIFPLVALSRLFSRLFLNFHLSTARSDLKETNLPMNAFLILLLGGEARLLRHLDLPIGSSLILLGKKE
ncbi:MAG: class I SAM-dependent methyltransferase [Thermodesulfobacteriota bacterium]